MNMLLPLRRKYLAGRCSSGPVREWLKADLPEKNQASNQVSFLAVDLEMTGLDPRQDSILSAGWVAVDSGRIALDTAQHMLINDTAEVGQSAVIHQIRDVDLESGVGQQQVMEALLAASQGRVLVFHNASLDCRFLNRVWKQYFGIQLLAPVVDTLLLEKQLLQRADTPIEQGALRLASCRERYNLPEYAAHNALVDALATAELLLSIMARLDNCKLGRLLRAS